MIPQPQQIPGNWGPGHDWSAEMKVAQKALEANKRAIEKNKGTALKSEKEDSKKGYEEPNYG